MSDREKSLNFHFKFKQKLYESLLQGPCMYFDQSTIFDLSISTSVRRALLKFGFVSGREADVEVKFGLK